MKSTSRTKSKTKQSDPLEAEFRFNYGEAKPNRFAGRIRAGSVAVLLDPDVARVFRESRVRERCSARVNDDHARPPYFLAMSGSFVLSVSGFVGVRFYPPKA